MQRLQSGGDAPCRFPTTQWSRVVTAGSRGSTEAREALSSLCQAYWYPIYAYVRHRGQSPEQAQDATQEFFAYMLEHDVIAMADRLRAGGFGHFSSPSVPGTPGRRTAIAGMRQNGAERGLCSRSNRSMPNAGTKVSQPTCSLPSGSSTARGRLTLLARVVERLRGEYDNADRSDRFRELLAIRTRDRASASYAEIALRRWMTEGHVRVAVHRLRARGTPSFYARKSRLPSAMMPRSTTRFAPSFAALELEARK